MQIALFHANTCRYASSHQTGSTIRNLTTPSKDLILKTDSPTISGKTFYIRSKLYPERTSDIIGTITRYVNPMFIIHKKEQTTSSFHEIHDRLFLHRRDITL